MLHINAQLFWYRINEWYTQLNERTYYLLIIEFVYIQGWLHSFVNNFVASVVMSVIYQHACFVAAVKVKSFHCASCVRVGWNHNTTYCSTPSNYSRMANGEVLALRAKQTFLLRHDDNNGSQHDFLKVKICMDNCIGNIIKCWNSDADS